MFGLYRPSSASDPTSPHVVYPSSLFSLDLGYALWYPEPHDSTGEPQIGDVGYIRKGAFIRLFNINASKPEHQVRRWKPSFEVTDALPSDVFDLDKRHRPIHHGHYPSHGVRKREISGSLSLGETGALATLSAGYTCKETQGALLVLQSQAYSETVFESRRLKIYMARQHEHWCAYVRDVLGHEVSTEDIVLVGGWVKTSADWAAMAFSNLVTKRHAALGGKAGQFVGFKILGSRTRVHSGPKSHRQGSRYREPGEESPTSLEQDQSIFLMRYRIKRRFGVLKTIVAGAGYDRLPGNGSRGDAEDGLVAEDSESGDNMEDNGLQWLEEKVVDPLDVLLDYILEVSDADVAIAYDQDIDSIIGDDDRPIDFATYVRKVQPPVEVKDQYGTISISELLAREQFEKLEHRLITATDLRKWPNATLDDAGTSAMAPVQFTDDPDLSLVLPTKWRYLCFDSRLTADAAPSSVLASSPNGELLAATSSELEIIVWRLSDGLSVQRLGHEGHTETIASIAFSPDGGSLISGSADRTAIVWSLETGRALLRLVGHRETIEHVQYITHGLRIVTASTDSAVKFWDAKSGAPLCHFPHGDEIERLLISPDGSRFGVQMKHSVALYDTDSIVQLAVLEPSHGAKVATIAFSASGDRLFIGDHRGGGRVCNTDNCKEVMHLEDFPSKTQASAFAPDGGPLAAVWSQAVAIVTRDGTVDFMYHLESLGTAVAFSPNGEFIAAAGGLNEGEGEIRVWSTTSRQLIAGFTAPSSNIWDTKFLPDSRRLLTFAKEGPACLWNVGDALRVR